MGNPSPLQMPAELGPQLAEATSILIDTEAPDQRGCAVRSLPAFQEAAKQHRVMPLRPLTHRLRCAGRAVAGGKACLEGLHPW